MLPGLATAAGLGIVIVDTVHAVAPIAVGLAVATLIIAGIRLMRSAQELRLFTADRHHKSLTDELTGLANRRHLFEYLEAFFAEQADVRNPRRSLAFLFLDLNLFKEVNDHFGHLAGDDLLQQLGPRLLRSLSRSDLLVRLGGDEFAVVLMDKEAENAAFIAQQLTASLGEPFTLKGVSARISASIGIAMSPSDASDINGLLQCADIAMYRAKLGHCPYAFFDPGLDVGNDWRLGDELRTAIERREFVLYYQPQLDLATGEIVGAEALVRWLHPKLGMLSPNKFLPLAEHAGLMPSLTALLLDDAFEQAASWRMAGHDLTVSVNLSPTNLLDSGFVELLRNLLDLHRIPSSSINLEITETSVIEHFEQSKRIIEELDDLGFVVSVDDFGAGFTSLSYLSSLTVRELKLDAKLVTGIASEERYRDRDLVRSTVNLGHSLGLRVVAEGVEDAATIDLMRELGADLGQGYFIGRPVLAGEIDFSCRFTGAIAAASRS
jgi:diguanylate cyclase